MKTPDNKFNNFFNDPTPAMHDFRPPPSKVVEAIMVICLQNNEWYKDAKIRFVLACTLAGLAAQVSQMKENGDNAPVSASEAAFMMLVGDMLYATRNYAGDEELREFPEEEFSRKPDESEEDED